ncbi:MAG: metal-sensing transcriptional repressor [Planctomycetota bacterium]|jgi:DNA-binding FrmR family transcriptional regulator
MATKDTHKGFKEVDSRLARIEGHVGGVRRMWQSGRPCHEVLLQMAALRAAMDRAARVILREHVESCIAQAVEQGRGEEAVEDLLRAVERLL